MRGIFLKEIWSVARATELIETQRKTPWVDSACVDSPGFPAPGAVGAPAPSFVLDPQIDCRRRTNVQQLTCNIALSCSFYHHFFSFVLLELKPFVLKGKVLGEELCEKVKNDG